MISESWKSTFEDLSLQLKKFSSIHSLSLPSSSSAQGQQTQWLRSKAHANPDLQCDRFCPSDGEWCPTVLISKSKQIHKWSPLSAQPIFPVSWRRYYWGHTEEYAVFCSSEHYTFSEREQRMYWSTPQSRHHKHHWDSWYKPLGRQASLASELTENFAYKYFGGPEKAKLLSWVYQKTLPSTGIDISIYTVK